MSANNDNKKYFVNLNKFAAHSHCVYIRTFANERSKYCQTLLLIQQIYVLLKSLFLELEPLVFYFERCFVSVYGDFLKKSIGNLSIAFVLFSVALFIWLNLYD